MDETSTLHTQSINKHKVTKSAAKSPRRSTLAFIRQFARTYMAIDNMPGLVLN